MSADFPVTEYALSYHSKLFTVKQSPELTPPPLQPHPRPLESARVRDGRAPCWRDIAEVNAPWAKAIE